MLDSISVTRSPWRKFCALADSLGTSHPTKAEVAALKAVVPTKRMRYSIGVAEPVVIDPSFNTSVAQMPGGSQRDAMILIRSTLQRQCDTPLGPVIGIP